MSCRFCGAVNTLCYWGPRPVKTWKRPVLLVISVPIVIGGFAFAWAMFGHQSILGVMLGLFLGAAGIFGIVIALLGCDECVARYSGSI